MASQSGDASVGDRTSIGTESNQGSRSNSNLNEKNHSGTEKSRERNFRLTRELYTLQHISSFPQKKYIFLLCSSF